MLQWATPAGDHPRGENPYSQRGGLGDRHEHHYLHLHPESHTCPIPDTQPRTTTNNSKIKHTDAWAGIRKASLPAAKLFSWVRQGILLLNFIPPRAKQRFPLCVGEVARAPPRTTPTCNVEQTTGCSLNEKGTFISHRPRTPPSRLRANIAKWGKGGSRGLFRVEGTFISLGTDPMQRHWSSGSSELRESCFSLPLGPVPCPTAAACGGGRLTSYGISHR